MSCTHSIVGSSRILPETSSSRYLGEMETTQLLASGMTNILSEFSMSSAIRVVRVCMSCRTISMLCEWINGPKQANSMRISNKMLKFDLSTYIAHKTRILLYEFIIRLSGKNWRWHSCWNLAWRIYLTSEACRQILVASFKMSCTHSIAGSSRILPETFSSRYLGEMEVTHLLISDMTSILSEFSMLSDIRVVQVCMSCRTISMIRECINGPKQVDRIRIANKMLKFVVSAYIAHKTRILLA